MSELLSMRLEPVRTVLKNEVNEIAVCVDLGRRTGVFYTMISITEPRASGWGWPRCWRRASSPRRATTSAPIPRGTG